MKKLVLLFSLLFLVSIAQAGGCITGPWVSRDKALHLVGSAGIVFGVDWVVKEADPALFSKMHDIGIGPGLAAGVARELYKVEHRSDGMNCEYASMTYDAAGLYLGHVATKEWLVGPTANGRGLAILYHREW